MTNKERAEKLFMDDRVVLPDLTAPWASKEISEIEQALDEAEKRGEAKQLKHSIDVQRAYAAIAKQLEKAEQREKEAEKRWLERAAFIVDDMGYTDAAELIRLANKEGQGPTL